MTRVLPAALATPGPFYRHPARPNPPTGWGFNRRSRPKRLKWYRRQVLLCLLRGQRRAQRVAALWVIFETIRSSRCGEQSHAVGRRRSVAASVSWRTGSRHLAQPWAAPRPTKVAAASPSPRGRCEEANRLAAVTVYICKKLSLVSK